MMGCLGSLMLVLGLGFAFIVGALALGTGGGILAVGLAVVWVHRQARKPRRKPGWSKG